jgi:hypothetical protein
MRTAAPCPECGHAITLLQVMSSPTPLHLRCRSCRLPVRAENLTLLVIAAGVALGLAIWQWILSRGITTAAVIQTAIVVLVAEAVVSLVVLNRGKLTAKKAGAS